MEIAYAEMDQHHEHIQGLKSYMLTRLKENIPGIDFNGETDTDKSLYTMLNVSFPETEMADMLLFNLDIAGISASGGQRVQFGH